MANLYLGKGSNFQFACDMLDTKDEGIKIKCVFSSQFYNSYFIGKFVDLKISGIHFAHCMHNLFLQIDKSIKSIIQFQ